MEHQPLDVLTLIFRDFNTCEFIKLRQVSISWKNIIEKAIKTKPIYCNNKFRNEHTYILRNAKIIDMQRCRQVTDEGLVNLLNVETLNLAGCSQITDSGLQYLINVQKINLSGCHRITDLALNSLTTVTHINISYCPQITLQGVKLLTKYTQIICDKHQKSLFENNVIASLDDRIEYRERPYEKLNVKCEDNYCKNKHQLSTITRNQSRKLDNQRCFLFDQIYLHPADKRDQLFLLDYQDLLPNSKLLDYQQALRRLYSNNIFNFINNIKSSNLDILIGGSTAISSVYLPLSFKPNDIDLYIKEINKDKLMLLEQIIYQTYQFKNIVVVRNQITVTWYLHLNDDTILSIQINILKITSWAEIFISNQTDLTCIGFEIKSSKFLYLSDRWNNILTSSFHYFSNILNFDNLFTITKSALKYQSRGFPCSIYPFEGQIPHLKETLYHIKNGDSCDISGPPTKSIATNFLPHVLCKYRHVENCGNKILFGSTVDNVFGNETPIPIIFFAVFKINKLLTLNTPLAQSVKTLFPSVRSYFDLTAHYSSLPSYGPLCSVTHLPFTVGIKCRFCDQFISLAHYIRQSSKKIRERSLCSHLTDSYSRSLSLDYLPLLISI